jgi:serpin B
MTRYFLIAALLPVLAVAAEPGPGLNRFGSNLYEQLAKSGQKNLILSPYSISGALSMAIAGAKGETESEMTRVLGPHADLVAIAERLRKAGNQGENVFLDANRVWLEREFTVLPDFRRTLEGAYGAPFQSVDFRKDVEAARREINSWTEEQTKGRIRDLFGPGVLTPDTRLVLTTAIYFYGKWDQPFDPAKTRPDSFTTAGGASVQTDFMNQTANFGYAETAAGQFLEMRYAGTGIAFDILLPKAGKPLETPTPERLTAWLGSLQNRRVKATVPKFRVESEFSLAPALKTLGMKTAFTTSADFSGIDGRRDLFLSAVVHKAFVDVAEAGTEAAAATGLSFALASARIDPDPVFRADHPFVFLIRDTRSGLILFSGRLMNPKS